MQRTARPAFWWLGGGAPTIDMWDLKPESKNGGEFKPISTAGDCRSPRPAEESRSRWARCRSCGRCGTREADHERGTYYLHTAYVPNPTVVHPSFGSVVSYELAKTRPELEIPAFISIGGGSMSPGFLGDDARARSWSMRRAGFRSPRWPGWTAASRSAAGDLGTIEESFIQSKAGGRRQGASRRVQKGRST